MSYSEANMKSLVSHSLLFVRFSNKECLLEFGYLKNSFLEIPILSKDVPSLFLKTASSVLEAVKGNRTLSFSFFLQSDQQPLGTTLPDISPLP